MCIHCKQYYGMSPKSRLRMPNLAYVRMRTHVCYIVGVAQRSAQDSWACMAVRVAVGGGVPEAVRLHLLRGLAWISGRWVEAVSGKTFPVLNPANGELIAEVREVFSLHHQNKLDIFHTRRLTWELRTLRRPLRLHTQRSAAGPRSHARSAIE